MSSCFAQKMLVFAFLAALVGCASRPNQDDSRAEFQRQDAVCKAALKGPALDAIRQKVYLVAGLDRPTFGMAADSSRANDQERAAIVIFDEMQTNCANGYAHLFSRYFGPQYVATHGRGITQAQANRVALYRGEITFGEYASRGAALSADMKIAFAELDRQRQQMAIQQQAAGAAMIGANAATTSATAQMMQASKPLYQPMAVTPQAPPVNCTSYRQGTFTNTTCR